MDARMTHLDQETAKCAGPEVPGTSCPERAA